MSQPLAEIIMYISTKNFLFSYARAFRNRAKSITMTFPPAFTLRLFFIHVDNTRDVSNKTTYVTFFAGTSAEEMVKISSTEVDARHIGWIKFPLRKPEGINVIKVEFKGPDNRYKLKVDLMEGSLSQGWVESL